MAEELNAAGHRARAVPTDVTDRDQVRHLVDTAVEEFGRIDVMLNNAGLMPLAPLERLKIDEWDQMIDVNIKGVLYGIAAALAAYEGAEVGAHHQRLVRLRPRGRSGATVYCATKFAVRALSEGLRREVKPYNIRTTVISPGAVAPTPRAYRREGHPGRDEGVRDKIAVGPDTFARMVAFAVNEPDDVDVNEILFRPTAQPV